MTSLVLIGAPAVGKSTVGALVAASLGVEFRDVDEVVAAQAGKSVAEIFATDGESEFRRRELEATLGCLDRGGVVALGGGAILTPGVRDACASHTVAWLRMNEWSALERISRGAERPLLAGEPLEQWRNLAASRQQLYEAAANLVIDTDGHSARAVANELLRRIDAIN